MAKYKRKPVVIEAVKITRPITIETADGTKKGQPGDYLITDQNGEQYPCPAITFLETYEPVKERIDISKLKRLCGKVFYAVKRKSIDLLQQKS
ncbi:hypothetical protein ACJ2A9_10470 [Anaerobacillus sp. MEB173]|uniref:hypothetical protein n=1 Tax=Anaerobacillus sp. MEB173 TaxID=3383345 RepID=UPI003F8D9831